MRYGYSPPANQPPATGAASGRQLLDAPVRDRSSSSKRQKPSDQQPHSESILGEVSVRKWQPPWELIHAGLR